MISKQAFLYFQHVIVLTGLKSLPRDFFQAINFFYTLVVYSLQMNDGITH